MSMPRCHCGPGRGQRGGGHVGPRHAQPARRGALPPRGRRLRRRDRAQQGEEVRGGHARGRDVLTSSFSNHRDITFCSTQYLNQAQIANG